MYLSRIQASNFRNFQNLDVHLSENTVIIGENRVGKSNLLFALRLVLDSSLPDSARSLKFSDMWDGTKLENWPVVEIHVEFTDWDDDTNLSILLTDYRKKENARIASLSYAFRPKASADRTKEIAPSAYEFILYGGGEETRAIASETRRRICTHMLPALRDAESDLSSWRNSPLRLLFDEATSDLSDSEVQSVVDKINELNDTVLSLAPIKNLDKKIRDSISVMSGAAHDLKSKLGMAPTNPLRVFRSLGLYIDDGIRAIADASSGSANLLLLALRLTEFELLRLKNERDYTFLFVEEPEAHLHPQLQRSIFHRLLGKRSKERGIIVTTHSPNIASVAPLKDILVLRKHGNQSLGYSLARLGLADSLMEDLERYIISTRADIYFARGVMFIEGDAEEALMSAFADGANVNLDELGIAVCNVGGTNFIPYVTLAASLDLPYVVITDWDPADEGPPLGKDRCLDLLREHEQVKGSVLEDQERSRLNSLSDEAFRAAMASRGLFLNSTTLEVEIAETPALWEKLLSVLEVEDFGSRRKKWLRDWKEKKSPVDAGRLLGMASAVGKGRLAGRLAVSGKLHPPQYIAEAIGHLVAKLSNV